MPRGHGKSTIPQEVCDRAKLLWEMYGDRDQAAEMCGINPSTLSAIKKRGWKAASYNKRPMPIDFPTKAARLGVVELCKLYGVGRLTIKRWSETAGRKPVLKRGEHLERYQKKPPRPLPDDFDQKQRDMTIAELCKHYAAGYELVKRWIGETPNPRPRWQGRHRQNVKGY